MADKTGQIKQLPITLQTAGGSAVSYASAAAFLAAGWSLVYEIGGVSVTPTYTWTVVSSALGRHEIGLTLQYGKGTLYVVSPSGYVSNVEAFILDVEANNLDNIAGLILSSAGTPTVDAGQTVYAYQVEEGDSFNRSLSIATTTLAYFGFTDLSWVTTSTAAARTKANRLATSPDFSFTADVTDATNRVVVIGWSTFPTGGSISGFAVTAANATNKTFTVAGDKRPFFNGVSSLKVWASTANDGTYTLLSMAYTGGNTVLTVSESLSDSTGDGTIAQADESKDFYFDVQLKGTKSFAVTAVSTVSKTFTVSGDQQRYFNVGGSLIVSGSTGNDNTYTITAIAYAGGNTTFTVSQAVPSAVADGNVKASIVLTPARGVLTVTRQEDRT